MIIEGSKEAVVAKRRMMVVYTVATVIVVAIVALWTWAVTKDEYHDTKAVSFTTNRDVNIVAEGAYVEAVSNEFFVYRKENGDIIYGTPQKPPPTWSDAKYFEYKKITVGGMWLHELGNVKFGVASLNGESPVKVVVLLRDAPQFWIYMMFPAIGLWLLAMGICYLFRPKTMNYQ